VLKSDSKTDVNKDLMQNILNSKNVYIAGEAFTHCVYSTVRDIALIVNSQDKHKPNIFIYENATSPVGGFENKVEEIKKELMELGVVFKMI
jgi:nicotinamidase-related amidase